MMMNKHDASVER